MLGPDLTTLFSSLYLPRVSCSSLPPLICFLCTAAATARQTADAMVGAAQQARKRADKADAVVNAAQQTLRISKKLAGSNTQLGQANQSLQAAGELSIAFPADSAYVLFTFNVVGAQRLVTRRRRLSSRRLQRRWRESGRRRTLCSKSWTRCKNRSARKARARQKNCTSSRRKYWRGLGNSKMRLLQRSRT